MTSQILTKIIDSIPLEGIDFEYCAVKQLETKSFTLPNQSSSLIQFEVLVDLENTSFILEPLKGKLQI
jgi:hypothetical protein